MLRLHIKAPFAAFRYMTAGSFRPTAPFITPAAAYGLVLNLAGIDSRHDDGKAGMTLMRTDLPALDLAIGLNGSELPEDQTIFQQLHNYPVGNTGKERQPECKGAKYNIQPIRRGYLAGLDAVIVLRGNDELIMSVRQGLVNGAVGPLTDGRSRYGVPFLGDNNFMIDVLREESATNPIQWFYPVNLRELDTFDLPKLHRMPIWIDRAEMSHTVTGLFAISEEVTLEPPMQAWTRVGPQEAVTLTV
jgi:CRISPR-associated protein Cas5t